MCWSSQLGELAIAKIWHRVADLRPGPVYRHRAANASRSLRAVAAGNRTQMAAVRRKMAKAEGAGIQDEDGIERAWLRRRGIAFPAVEHFLVAARGTDWTRPTPVSRPPGRRQHPQPTPGARIRAECGMGADSGFEPSVPRLSVVLVCYGCKACDGEADRAAGGRF